VGDASALPVEPPGTPDQRRRDEILDTASELFAAHGWRVSLDEIASACGIKPGSLYHHFESKEAIVVELVKRYQADLDRLAKEITSRNRSASAGPVEELIAEQSVAIARLAVRHSAAVAFTFYDPPGGASGELMQLARREPASIRRAMLTTLELGEKAGDIRSGLDLAVVSDRFCQTMLHVGLGLHHGSPTERVAHTSCRILLHGVATVAPKSGDLDTSPALTAVKEVTKTWPTTDVVDRSDRAAWLRAVGRAEFGRRGYEVTTVRDIAAAAGLGTGSVYRVIGSKEELLTSIMLEFSEKAIAGWTAALGSDATTVEKLDAVTWLQINVMERFYDEFRIQLAWLRQVPPAIPSLGWSFPQLLKALRTELGNGAKAGEIGLERPSSDLAARCVLDATWMPESIVADIGIRGAHQLARDTLLRGIAKR
jgi:AcrR family transcriptional regulator